MPKRKIATSPEAGAAITVLGQQIRLERQRRGWTVANLAARAGVSSPTIVAIEAGSPGTSIGNVFNAAVVVGVRLFGAERDELVAMRRRGEEVIALLPSRVVPERGDDAVPDF
ncbi:MAG: helix-turn-helix domain-containing protein [Acidimicrobiales bacterium]|nr:helix-turn-helix domain-containing protein [Actinomycetota bacterium]